MAVREKDLKLLWGRSGNRCAICRQELTEDKKVARGSYPLGEQAHIVGRTADSPRGQSILSLEEREGYHNLILVCPTDHLRIDKNEEDYPVEKLHMIKAEHELWVSRLLAEGDDRTQDAATLIYANLIDAAVVLLELERWGIWSSWAVGVDARIEAQLVKGFYEFSQKVVGAVWPGSLPELERTLQTVGIALRAFRNTLLKHVEEREEILYSVRFYKFLNRWDPEEHGRLVSEWETWVDSCEAMIFEAAKALNWFSSVVRRDINPLFFALEGKFLIVRGPVTDLKFETLLFEYDDSEKKRLPESLYEKLMGDKII